MKLFIQSSEMGDLSFLRIKRLHRGLLSLLVGMWLTTPAKSQEGIGAKNPVATVDGQVIYEDELQPLIEGQIHQIRTQEYEVKKKALENIVERKLLEAAAKKKGVSVDELLAEEVDQKTTEPTDAEIEAAYQAQKDRLNLPLEALKDQIRTALKQVKLQQARRKYLDNLRKNAQVSVLLAPPRFDVSYDSNRLRGNPAAPVTIVEFSDFQCPFCQSAFHTVENLLTKYQGQVKLAYKDFPLRQIHSQAQAAAVAARCALEQGKFWQYHDLLFTNFNKLDEASLVGHASALELQEEPFKSCLNSSRYDAQIQENLQEGMSLGVSGTPSFFINGIPVIGSQPAEVFERIIETELAALGEKSSSP